MNKVELKMDNINNEWIIESYKILNENDENIYVVISAHIKKLLNFDTPKILNTVNFFHNELKKTNPAISNLFLSIFSNSFNISLLTTELKIEMAVNEILDENHPLAIQNAIDKYKIDKNSLEGRQAICEISRRIIKRKHWLFLLYISHVQIYIDQDTLVEIAELIAKIDPWLLAGNINKFKISNEQTRIEIAKTIIEKDPWVVATYVSNFEISNHKVLAEIALLIAQKKFQGFIRVCYIFKYRLYESGRTKSVF